MVDEALPQEPGDARPVVGRTASNRSVWLFAGVMLALSLGLFGALDARRTSLTSPSVTRPVSQPGNMIAGPPDLAIPPDTASGPFGEPGSPVAATLQFQPAPVAPAISYASPSPPPAYPRPSRTYDFPPALPPAPQPAFVYQSPPARPTDTAAAKASDQGQRISAGRFENPSTSVAQGTLIQAVLETALDSNRAGYARAVVSRDVTSFDGSRVLIPRGSKLFGEYKADLALGQNRALIQWHRLTRPDGVVIDINSPSADPLGRAGVRGKVNTHFLERFSGAILQSVLDVGVQVAARKATGDTVILALPNSLPQVTANKPEEIKPTLKVKAGTSVSVFVVHDLDFTEVEN